MKYDRELLEGSCLEHALFIKFVTSLIGFASTASTVARQLFFWISADALTFCQRFDLNQITFMLADCSLFDYEHLGVWA